MIPALGAGGREFDSRITPFYCVGFSVGGVAQMVERMLSMHEAQGSIPCSSTFFPREKNFCLTRLASQKKLQGRESNPGFLRDRQEY